MKSNTIDIRLKPVDDLFMTDEGRIEENKEKITEIELEKLYPFDNHPFSVRDDDLMNDTVESIKRYGVLHPVLARSRGEGGYEIISGHRRHRACEIAGLDTVPVIVRELTDDEAVIVMVDTNMQRENILPSERAFAYKMKLEAMNNQGKRNDLTCSQVGNKLKGIKTVEVLSEQVGVSKNQIYRFVALTNLNEHLLDMVDSKEIGFNPAVELSYLKFDEQDTLLQVMEEEQCTPSLAQAKRLKKISSDNMCNYECMSAILSEEKKKAVDKVVIKTETIAKYFPKTYTPKKIHEAIIELLDDWYNTQT